MRCRVYSCIIIYVFKYFIYFFLERGERRETERERDISAWLPLPQPPLGTWPTTQACALTGNRTSNTVVRRLVLNPLSHTTQGVLLFINYCTIFQMNNCKPMVLLPHPAYKKDVGYFLYKDPTMTSEILPQNERLVQHTQINVTHCIHRLYVNQMIILLGTEKALDKTQHPSRWKHWTNQA